MWKYLFLKSRIVDKAHAGEIDGYSVDVIKVEGGPHGKLRLCAGK